MCNHNTDSTGEQAADLPLVDTQLAFFYFLSPNALGGNIVLTDDN